MYILFSMFIVVYYISILLFIFSKLAIIDKEGRHKTIKQQLKLTLFKFLLLHTNVELDIVVAFRNLHC